MSDVNHILISDLQTLVIEGKSESSARNYIAMLKALKSHLQNESFSHADITPGFAKKFGDYMLDKGIAPSTVRLYLQMLRALLNQTLGHNYKSIVKEAFHDVGSKNETVTNRLTTYEIKVLVSDRLQDNISLKKARDVFMFSLYGAGIQLKDIKPLARNLSGNPADYLPQQKEIIHRFALSYDKSFGEYVVALSDKDYTARLDTIGRMLRLKSPLTPQSAGEGWISTARDCGLPRDIISRCINTPMDFDMHTDGQYYRAVANHIRNLNPRWYCIRCIDEPAADISTLIKSIPNLLHDECLDIFIPPQPHKKHNRAGNVLQDIIFIHCPAEYAISIKKSLWPKAFIYANRSTGNPSIIPDNEMKLFMLLSNISNDTVEYFFPEVKETISQFNTNDRVTIVNGNFSGQVGVVKKLSDNRLKVFIKIEAMNGAIITAEIHKSFLKPGD